jgi:hypothetical protein
MIDLVCSTVDSGVDSCVCHGFKRRAFEAILQEETEAGRCDAGLIESLKSEIAAKFDTV